MNALPATRIFASVCRITELILESRELSIVSVVVPTVLKLESMLPSELNLASAKKGDSPMDGLAYPTVTIFPSVCIATDSAALPINAFDISIPPEPKEVSGEPSELYLTKAMLDPL